MLRLSTAFGTLIESGETIWPQQINATVLCRPGGERSNMVFSLSCRCGFAEASSSSFPSHYVDYGVGQVYVVGLHTASHGTKKLRRAPVFPPAPSAVMAMPVCADADVTADETTFGRDHLAPCPSRTSLIRRHQHHALPDHHHWPHAASSRPAPACR